MRPRIPTPTRIAVAMFSWAIGLLIIAPILYAFAPDFALTFIWCSTIWTVFTLAFGWTLDPLFLWIAKAINRSRKQ